MLQQWNNQVRPYLKIHLPQNSSQKPVECLRAIAAIRSNLSSAARMSEMPEKDIQLFKACWASWKKEIEKEGLEVFPGSFGNLAAPVGKIIYSCSPRVSRQTNILIVPGLRKNKKIVSPPISLAIFPTAAPFPSKHPYRSFAPHWRGILGEMDLLLVHLDIQHAVMCGIEAIHKTSLIAVSKARETVVGEIERRRKTMADSIQHETSAYQLATNYWRLEECFWGILHDDGRPQGYSFFDTLRRRLQDWRMMVRKEHSLSVRDFLPRKDLLAAINKEVSGMILKKRPGVPPGTVLWQLRPVVTIKEKNVQRVLKGRVICT